MVSEADFDGDFGSVFRTDFQCRSRILNFMLGDAPYLIGREELANALNYHPKVFSADLEDYMREFFGLDGDLVPPSAEYSSHTTRTARRLSISAYDASYVALSDLVGTKLVTADKRLHSKIVPATRSFLLSNLGKTWTLTD